MYQFGINGLTVDTRFQFTEWTNVNCPIHCHYSIEAVIVLSGVFKINKDGESYILKENDMMLIMPFQLHGFTTEDSSKVAIIEFSPEIISKYDSYFKNKSPEKAICKIDRQQISYIYDHLKNIDKNHYIETNCIVYELISIALRESRLVNTDTSGDVFKKALVYIFNHYQEQITLKSVADALYISYRYLSRVFSKKSDMKFTVLLNNLRLQKAITLMDDENISISEICYICGWGSIRNFNRVFLKEFSLTPTQFRNSKKMYDYMVSVKKED